MGRRWFRRRDDDVICGNVRRFSYESLQMATDNFSEDMLLGQGGFAKVYKGNLSNGSLVAVKVYSPNLSPFHREEYLAKFEAISQIRHRNMVQVIGCCIDKHHLLLVTEYVANGSLLDLLEDPQRRESSDFNWDRRAAICIDIARCLSYLHNDAIPRFIHMDIKPANILLDHNFTPKIADFDLMKPFYELEESELPHQTDVGIAGTYGYIDPEYMIKGHYSEKSDVYAFGVVMLEIIGGRRAISRGQENILGWASKLVKSDRILEMIDPLLPDVATDDAQSFIDLALLCAKRDPKRRPNMLDVAHMLYGVCNSSSLSVTRPDMSLVYHSDVSFYGQEEEEGLEGKTHSDSVAWTLTSSEAEDSENEGQCSVARNGWTDVESGEIADDSSSKVQIAGEIGACSLIHDTIMQSEEAGARIQQQQSGTVLSGWDNIVERLSKKTVSRKHTPEYDFPEAVYPPFLTSVYRRRSSFRFHGGCRRPFP